MTVFAIVLLIALSVVILFLLFHIDNLKEILKDSKELNQSEITGLKEDIVNYESRIVQFVDEIEGLNENIKFLELKHQVFLDNTKEPSKFFIEQNFSDEYKELFYINETAKRLKVTIYVLFQKSNPFKEIEKTKNLMQ